MKVSVDFQVFVDEVFAKNDIVDYISRYTTLKRVGNRYQALCPLHNDQKTPSFSVSPDKQLFTAMAAVQEVRLYILLCKRKILILWRR